MCAPKMATPPKPAPPPAAPPPPADTATGFASAGSTGTTDALKTRRTGYDSLRVALNVPDGQAGGLGVSIP